MKNGNYFYTRTGQSILEYIILIGIITISLYYMGPAIKRGTQSLVKVAADQIGNQAASDQEIKRTVDGEGHVVLPDDGEDDSFLAKAYSTSDVTGRRLEKFRNSVGEQSQDIEIEETVKSYSNSTTDMGFTVE